MALISIHPSFKLNGTSYNFEELKEVAYSLVKEGLRHEIEIGDFLLDWLSNSKTLVVSTSGATGHPKLIRLQKIHMLNSAKATGEFLELLPDNSALLCLPLKYIAGKMMVIRALVLGLNLYYTVPTSSPLKSTSKHFDFCAMVPMQLKNSLGEISKIRKVLVGGAPVTEELKKAIRKKGNSIFETFGMTETISHIAMRKLSGVERSDDFRTLNNIEIDTDQRACLVVNAPHLGANKVITNDVVIIKSATAFQWLGRIDNVINSGGVKLHPEIIEEKLNAVIGGRFFIAGIPDKSLGEKLVLIIEGNRDTNLLEAQLCELKNLQKFEIPKAVYSIPDFVMTESGKINRRATIQSIIGHPGSLH